MRTLSKLLLGAAGIAALAGVAYAAERDAHVLNVVLPDGSIEHIRYVGNVAPHVVIAPGNVAVATVPVAFAPAGLFGAGDPFAMMDQMMAQMEARTDAMLREAAMLSAQGPALNGRVDEASLKSLPAGTVSYSFTSFSSGNGAGCSQSVQVTSLGSGQAPKVVKQSSGDCSAMNATRVTPTVQPVAPARAEQPKIVPAHYEAQPAAPKQRETI